MHYMLRHVHAHRENPTELCFVLGDWWLWGSVGLVIIVVTARLFLELARLNDKINMAKEIIRTACAWFFCFGERQAPTMAMPVYSSKVITLEFATYELSVST